MCIKKWNRIKYDTPILKKRYIRHLDMNRDIDFKTVDENKMGG